MKDNLANVINATYEEYGVDAQMIAHADDPRVDRAKVCTITNLGLRPHPAPAAGRRSALLLRHDPDPVKHSGRETRVTILHPSPVQYPENARHGRTT